VNPYELLGVAPTATVDDAEAAYHRQLRRYHPDLHHGGTAQERAEAESRTRALNEAIEQIRSGYASVGVGGATDERREAGGDPAGPHHGHDRGRADAQGARWDEWQHGQEPAGAAAWRSANWDERPGETYFGQPHLTTPCPLCGLWFARRDELTVHVKVAHNLRLEREPRPSWFGGSYLGRKLAGLRHISLWFLVPFNAVAAALAATLIAGNIDTDLSYWVFAVGMSPTFIRVLDRTERDD